MSALVSFISQDYQEAEARLRRALEQAQAAYTTAATQYRRLVEQSRDDRSLHPAKEAEMEQAYYFQRIALDNYKQALKAFSDFIVAGNG